MTPSPTDLESDVERSAILLRPAPLVLAHRRARPHRLPRRRPRRLLLRAHGPLAAAALLFHAAICERFAVNCGIHSI